MTMLVIDVGTSQRNLDWAAARAAGVAGCYVKLGGDNAGRYVAPHYTDQVDASRAHGFITGHYWVPGANNDPVGAADYFVDHLHGWTRGDFAVLDNESLDGAHRYSDAQAAAWINRVASRLQIPGRQVKHYSGLADARTTAWPKVLATGTQFIIAAYSYPALQLPVIPTVPAHRIDGHQYSSSGRIGGTTVDLNAFLSDALTTTSGLDPETIKEADVAKHKSFQNASDFRIRPQWQRFPWQNAPRQENIAQGTGGAGLYDMLLNLYLKEFPADGQIEGRFVVVNAKSGASSDGYGFTVDGSPSGEVKAAIPARVTIPGGSFLYLELRTVKGADPLLDLWGVDIANLVIG